MTWSSARPPRRSEPSSGSAAVGGNALLTATLTSAASGLGVAGQTVDFKLDGTFVGSATTDGDGVATLAGIPNDDPLGTNPGAVVASFAGSTNYIAAADASGDLVVVASASILGDVGGTASFGGTATLVATLVDLNTTEPIADASITFTLDGIDVGTATTDVAGIATLAGVVTTDGAGTHAGAVAALFAGDATFAASIATGPLVVSQAATTLGDVSGTAVAGGNRHLDGNAQVRHDQPGNRGPGGRLHPRQRPGRFGHDQ